MAQSSTGVKLRRGCSSQREEKTFSFAKTGSPHTAADRYRHDHSCRWSAIGHLRHGPPRPFRSRPDRKFGGELLRAQLVNPAARSRTRFGRRVAALRRRAGPSPRIYGRRRSCKRRWSLGPRLRPVAGSRKLVAPGASIWRPDDRRTPLAGRPGPVLIQGPGLGVGNFASLCRRPSRLEAALLSR